MKIIYLRFSRWGFSNWTLSIYSVSGIQIMAQNPSILQPDTLLPFKHWTCPAFGSPPYNWNVCEFGLSLNFDLFFQFSFKPFVPTGADSASLTPFCAATTWALSRSTATTGWFEFETRRWSTSRRIESLCSPWLDKDWEKKIWTHTPNVS